MNQPISASVWIGAVTGGLAGAVLTFCMQRFLEALRISRLSRNLSATPEPFPEDCCIRVKNSGVETVEGAVAYISLTYNPDVDVLDGQAFISPGYRVHLREDRLCWSLTAPDPNPFRTSIYPGEKQALRVVKVDQDRIEIPSEQGWASDGEGKRSRVFLIKKRYEGSFHLVAKNTLRRSFDLVIDPDCEKNRVKLTAKRSHGLCALLWGKLPQNDK